MIAILVIVLKKWLTRLKIVLIFNLVFLQLIFINIRYGSPRPRASVWETSRDGGVTFEPVQYYADDCMLYFSLPNNGEIVNADDVNCITTSSL